MSVATVLSPRKVDAPPPVPIHRFSVADYVQMGKHGILDEYDRVELLEGWIVPKMTKNPPHDATVHIVGRLLRRLIPADWTDRIQSTIHTGDSAPEPDVAIVRGDDREYLTRQPEADDVGLLIEVSESSLAIDRGIKARLYARAGVSCYWIVNLIDGQLEVLTDPSGPGDAPAYATRQVFGPDDDVPFVLKGQELARIAVRELLP